MDYREKGTLILSSPLKNLDVVMDLSTFTFWETGPIFHTHKKHNFLRRGVNSNQVTPQELPKWRGRIGDEAQIGGHFPPALLLAVFRGPPQNGEMFSLASL